VIAIIVAAIIAAIIVIPFLSMVSYSFNTSTENIQTYEQTIEIEDR
jgi:ABC-type spermidine/putrescine transport system permease subunit II